MPKDKEKATLGITVLFSSIAHIQKKDLHLDVGLGIPFGVAAYMESLFNF